MKSKQGAQYYLYDQSRAVGIYFVVVLLVLIAALIISHATGARVTTGGLEMGGFIFLFVLGLNAYKPQLRLFVQSGLSRRTLWLSFLLCAAAVSVVMTVMHVLFVLIFGQSLRVTLFFTNLYEMLSTDAARVSLIGVLWTLLANLSLMTLGFCISTAYYRMAKPVKVLVSVGVPVLLFVVMPIAELLFDWFEGFSAIWKAYAWAMGLGFGTTHPLRAAGSMAVFSAVMAGLSYLLLRRAPLREA